MSSHVIIVLLAVFAVMVLAVYFLVATSKATLPRPREGDENAASNSPTEQPSSDAKANAEPQNKTTTAVAAWWWLNHRPAPKDKSDEKPQ